jgi:lysophospholipase L1-like esterase
VDPAPDETCRARIRAGLAALAERARQGDARLVVVTYPVASRQPAYKPRGDLAARALNGLLAAECRAASVPVLDVVDCVQTQERALGDGFFYDDGLHLVPAGSAATARCVARELPGLLEGPKS